MAKKQKKNLSDNEITKTAPSKNSSKKAQNNAKSNIRQPIISSQKLWYLGALTLATFFGYTHYQYCFNLFENERHFSHLATIERDMSFRTEMGLYYSYYKTLIHADTFKTGLNDILNDKITEYPSTINVLKRFNLWPEVFFGSLYRLIVKEIWENKLKLKTKQCWVVNRGQGKSQVNSCEGWGDEHYFYVIPVFLLHGFVLVGSLFMLGYEISDSYLGGIVTVVCYYFNHGEATRVMWTPPLRESWSFPFLPLQMLFVIRILKNDNDDNDRKYFDIKLILASLLFMISWQFAQFALLTQTASILVLRLLDLITSQKFNKIIYSQIICLILNYILQFGNEMLLTSFFFSCVLISLVIDRVDDKFFGGNLPFMQKFKILKILIFIPIWFLATFQLKNLIARILNVEDDKHIFDILKSKFIENFDTFDTKLYTCAKEFDFIEVATWVKLFKTGLLPIVLVVTVIVGVRALLASISVSRISKISTQKVNPVNLYITLQMLAFTLLAFLIMRLKLFMTPTMCILASMAVNKKFNLFGFNWKITRTITFLTLLAGFFIAGQQNIQTELNKMGNFENLPQEEMFEWIIKTLPKNGQKNAPVFAGAMPTMANLKHITERAVVNHPHYENVEIRNRTFNVYTMWSRRPIKKIHATMKKLKVSHFIYEHGWCLRSGSNGCSMPELFDLMEPEYKDRMPTCRAMMEGNRVIMKGYFETVFENDNYSILKIL